MYPVLFHIGSFPIHTYGFMGAVGFLAIVAVMLWRSKKIGLNPDRVVDVIFWSSLASIAGSRLVYVAQHPEQFATIGSIVNIRAGGLVFYGALVTGLPVGGWLMTKYGLPFYKLMDICATAFPLGHVLTRSGCFAAGCCHGKPTDHWVGVTFDHPLSVAVPNNLPVHPTQLYEAGYNLVIFAVLNWYYGKKKFDGQVMLLYLTLYAALRFVNEYFRGDESRGYFLQSVFGTALSYSQGVSIVVAVGALAVFLVGAKRAAEQSARMAQATTAAQEAAERIKSQVVPDPEFYEEADTEVVGMPEDDE